MRSFDELCQLACIHVGGGQKLEASLPRALAADELKGIDDSVYLSAMSRRIFRAGLRHAMVDAKWPSFESVFHNFDPYFCAMLSEDDFDICMKNAALIRHRGKLYAIRHNAQYILETAKQFGGFGHFLASWELCHTAELWWSLKKSAKQLGGNSGPNFLRMVGRDTFLLTRDVVAVLKREAVIDRDPTSKKDVLACQQAFIHWHEQSGRPLCEVSRIVSHTATL